MRYYSTNGQSPLVDFKAATLLGQAPDKGLYFPEAIPVLDRSFWTDFRALQKEELGFRVMRPFTGDAISDADLSSIVQETTDFDFPLVPVSQNAYALELYHGPTLAFKDVGARFMSRCLGLFSKQQSVKSVVLVATSGDTGGAVANGFLGVEGVEVVILYPSGKVSMVQEKQLTTLGQNIHALEVDGSFDDCQRMVKHAFTDDDLKSNLFLTSANSINVARWLPQQLYYFYALQQWDKSDSPVISVPSGNFGNICAGLMAYAAGLPVKHFIAACNANRVVPDFFNTGKLVPQPAIATISNAMDVGNPSNFVRVLEIFNNKLNHLKSVVSSCSISDAETKEVLLSVMNEHNYLLDPHGAVAYVALQNYLSEHGGLSGIFLETAHPVKFHDVVEPLIGRNINLPESVQLIMNKTKKSVRIGTDYEELKSALLKLN